MGILTTMAVVAGLTGVIPPVAAAAVAGCTGNAIVCENQLPGTPQSQWDVDGAGDPSIQGFATSMSANVGQTVQFKIKTDAAAYSIEIYRLGYYQGNGARKVADVTPSATLPQNQPACATDPETEIYDCGTWSVSASWGVPATAVSGVYIALLTRSGNSGQSHIPFVVRKDASTSEVVFQTSDSTWQAYNTYGGSSFYKGVENGRAYKLSYNRPFSTRNGVTARDYLFSNEYPMIRFLESNGYDMSYISSLDTDQSGSGQNGNGTNLRNHKVFLSVGHDEYWSEKQRSNVQDARDAGVNLAFFSGNEVYWKTRWEPSQDGSNTANRTLVCYKDTWANTQIDPQTPTSTWRDPRMGVGKPENSLTGTLYMANFSDLAITVSDQEGKMRLWRNTSLASQAPGASTALAPHTVGYESDEDLDNGFRPAGLIRLSTTTGAVPEMLQDFGNTVAPGTTTHHLTQYRAPSGALVFGAGTVQWAWGLDTNHDGTVSPVDSRMRQATVNILADMSAVATTLISGLAPATKSTDTLAPTAIITAPSTGAIGQGSTLTVTGTATDSGGGAVAGVEVSLDAGQTWHPATGRASFSYTGVVSGTGSNVVRARAIDDSGNIQPTAAVAPSTSSCPCSIFGNVEPATPAASDSSPVTVGTKFTTSSNGFITGLRFYKGAGNTGTHVGKLYRGDGIVLSTVTFSNESATGWQTGSLPSAVPVTAGVTYVVAYTAPNGHYAADLQYFAYSGKTSDVLTALGSGANENGVYTTGVGMPASSYEQTNYYVDVVYSPTDSTPITVASASPIDGSSSIPTSSVVTATYSRDAIPQSVSFTLKDAAGNAASGSTTYDPAARKSTFTPAAPLTPNTAYTASVMASATDVGPMATPAQWSFNAARPDAVPGVCPCSLFNDSDLPEVTADGDPDSVELGVAFTADTNGQITGVRFHKGQTNTGAHSISLWDASGNRVATAPVTGESTIGWQTANFASPVSVTGGATYIASYRAPVGHYSYTSEGLRTAINKAPLHTQANASRYTYGSGAPISVSTANYFVDPVFTVAGGSAPSVSAVTPANLSTSVPLDSSVAITFDQAVQPGSATITLADSAGVAVPGTMAALPLGPNASFDPTSDLTSGNVYTVTVTGAKNLGGAPMAAPFVSSFTTSGSAACPCSLLPSTTVPVTADSGDASAITIGLQFNTNTDGVINGLRYYRSAANTGTHSGTLYSATGSVLATLTFPTTAPGWQTASFSNPVAVTADTTYVASAYMPVGHYSVAANFFANNVVNLPLTGTLGTYAYGSNTFPNLTWNNNHYYVDVSFSPVTVPKSPTAVTATKGDSSATVSWTGGFDGGKPITSYRVIPYIGSAAQTETVISGSAPATTATIAGLSNGTKYTFTVTAINSIGAGAQSEASNPVMPGSVPAAPTGVSATGGDGSAIVTWTAPTDVGSPLSSYVVTPYVGFVAQAPTVVSGAPPSTSATITGLIPGTAYSFRVAATSEEGTGAASASPPVTVCPCSLLPTTATPPMIDSGETDPITVGLRFTADVDGFITGLRYYRNSANVGNHTGTLYVADGSPQATLTFSESEPGWQMATFSAPVAITAGTTYVAGVFMPVGRYSNAPNYFASPVANGPLTGLQGTFTYGSDAYPSSTLGNSHYFVDVIFSYEATTTGSTVPSAPTNVSAAPNDQSATVSWTAPNNGGSTISGYTVIPYIGTTAQTPLMVSGSPAPTTATVGGLTNGTAYTFAVTAKNAVGSGPASTPSTSVTPMVPMSEPGAPTNVTASRGDASATVTWTAPADGGSPITDYSVTPFIAGAPQTAVPATGTSAVLSGLTNGTAYTFSVNATNAIGTSAASAQSPAVTPATRPSAPTSVSATRGDASAVVSWTAPADGGSTITSYVVTPFDGATAKSPTTVTGSPAGTSTTVSALNNGTSYTFTVTAVNGVGAGPASSASTAVTPMTTPGAPTAVTAAAGNTSATVTWTAPASNGGSAITSYTVTPYVGTSAQTARTVTGNPPAATLAVTGLTNGTAYTFRVTANSAAGAGAASAPSAAVTPAAPTAPAAPTGVTGVPGDASVTVSWTAPNNGGSAITGYTVTPYIGATAQDPTTVTVTSATINGLANGTAYTFRTAAINAIGTGATGTSGSVKPFGVPGAPTNVTGIGGSKAVYVSWSAPASDGGSAISNYTVTRYVNGASEGTTSAGTATNVTISGLTNGTTYTFAVTATNARGASPVSVASAGVKPFAIFVQGLGARAKMVTTITATPTSILTAGNRLVVMVGVKGTTTTTAQSVTDSAGNGYVKVAQFRGSGSDATTEMSVWTAPIAAGAGSRPVVTARSSASATMAIAVTEYAGLSTTAGLAAVDQQRTASGSAAQTGTAQSGATDATAAQGEVAIGFYLDGGPSRTISAGSGYTARVKGARNSSMEYYIEDQTIWSSGTTANAQFGISASTTMPWLAATVVFKRQ